MRRRTSGTLADRVAGTDRHPPPPPVKHCWVTGPAGRLPGLLLAWRQGPDGWQGRVVHLVPETAGWVLVDEWLPAAVLEGAGSTPDPSHVPRGNR
jgi:hypothetical protein